MFNSMLKWGYISDIVKFLKLLAGGTVNVKISS